MNSPEDGDTIHRKLGLNPQKMRIDSKESRIKVVAILRFCFHTVGAKLFRGVAAVVAVPAGFAMIC
jgi:hypothetical protein